jgi:hypothetical protein
MTRHECMLEILLACRQSLNVLDAYSTTHEIPGVSHLPHYYCVHVCLYVLCNFL